MRASDTLTPRRLPARWWPWCLTVARLVAAGSASRVALDNVARS